jgi:hypothetical protein
MAASSAKSTSDKTESEPGKPASQYLGRRLSHLQRTSPAQQPDARLLDLREDSRLDGRPSHPHHIPARFDQIPDQTHRFMHLTPHTISLYRLAKAPAYCKTRATKRLVVWQHAHHEQWMCVANPRLPHQPEPFLVGQTIPALHLNTIADCKRQTAQCRAASTGTLPSAFYRFAFILDRQALAAPEAAGRKHVAPAGRAHPGKKAVHTTAAAALGLISSFGRHASILLATAYF